MDFEVLNVKGKTDEEIAHIAHNSKGDVVVVVKTRGEDDVRVDWCVKVSKEANRQGVHAGNLVRELAKITDGGGGGRPDFAQGGGRDKTKIDSALEALPILLGRMRDTYSNAPDTSHDNHNSNDAAPIRPPRKTGETVKVLNELAAAISSPKETTNPSRTDLKPGTVVRDNGDERIMRVYKQETTAYCCNVNTKIECEWWVGGKRYVREYGVEGYTHIEASKMRPAKNLAPITGLEIARIALEKAQAAYDRCAADPSVVSVWACEAASH